MELDPVFNKPGWVSETSRNPLETLKIVEKPWISRWFSSSRCVFKPFLRLVQGPGFGYAGPLILEVSKDEPPAIVMRFTSPYDAPKMWIGP